MTQNEFCQHIKDIHELKVAQKHECAECIKTNSEWLHLRTCQTCGVTLCCDDSPNRHMTEHYHQTHHPVVSSAELGERWLWCYEDDAFVEY